MPGIYLDTSALGRVVLGEVDAPAIRARWPSSTPGDERAARGRVPQTRQARGVSAAVESILGLIRLSALPRALLEEASLIGPLEVRSLDAIHLTTARELHAAGEIAAVLTYDHQLQAGFKPASRPLRGRPRCGSVLVITGSSTRSRMTCCSLSWSCSNIAATATGGDSQTRA